MPSPRLLRLASLGALLHALAAVVLALALLAGAPLTGRDPASLVALAVLSLATLGLVPLAREAPDGVDRFLLWALYVFVVALRGLGLFVAVGRGTHEELVLQALLSLVLHGVLAVVPLLFTQAWLGFLAILGGLLALAGIGAACQRLSPDAALPIAWAAFALARGWEVDAALRRAGRAVPASVIGARGARVPAARLLGAALGPRGDRPLRPGAGALLFAAPRNAREGLEIRGAALVVLVLEPGGAAALAVLDGAPGRPSLRPLEQAARGRVRAAWRALATDRFTAALDEARVVRLGDAVEVRLAPGPAGGAYLAATVRPARGGEGYRAGAGRGPYWLVAGEEVRAALEAAVGRPVDALEGEVTSEALAALGSGAFVPADPEGSAGRSGEIAAFAVR